MSRPLPIRSSPQTNIEHLFGNSAMLKDTYLYPVVLLQRPETVTIYNVSTTDGSWTRIPAAGTTLTNVLTWKLSEKSGNDFYYAYEDSPSTYMTGWGMIQRDTSISAIWVQRTSSTNIDCQLEVWE